MSDLIDEEGAWRRERWSALQSMGGPTNLSPHILRELSIYGGAQGVWVDKARTGKLTEDGIGVTVSLLHTGSSYADDLSSDGVLYHYPSTRRPPGRDLSEIEATKAAGRLGLPVFVITYPSPESNRRDVNLGWVEGWDDEARIFLITFGPRQQPRLFEVAEADDEPFELVEKVRGARREVAARPGQARFSFQVFQRYGAQCAACGIGVKEVLQAAHLRPKNRNGSDDPRNGLVLCALHHCAFDAGLFAIEPSSLRIYYKPSGPDADMLRVYYPSLEHLPKKPHQEALEWAWQRWRGIAGETKSV